MSKTSKDCLVEILEDLDDEQFKKFKNKLVDRKEEPRVRRGAMQHADRLDVADKLVSTFTEERAAQVAIEILEHLDFRQEAAELRRSVQGVAPRESGGDEAGTSPVSAGDSKFMVEGKHFVDHHRTALTQRICQVDPILDHLLEKDIVNQESYDQIRAQTTEQKKMRELFSGPLNSSGMRGKDEFYLILEQQQPHLMRELKKT